MWKTFIYLSVSSEFWSLIVSVFHSKEEQSTSKLCFLCPTEGKTYCIVTHVWNKSLKKINLNYRTHVNLCKIWSCSPALFEMIQRPSCASVEARTSDRLYKGVTWSMSKFAYLMSDVKIVQNLVLLHFTFIHLAGASKVQIQSDLLLLHNSVCCLKKIRHPTSFCLFSCLN